MNNIKATIVKDSVNNDNVRLTTYVLQFPKFILAQFNTHRVFSRSASSSRAIPVTTLISRIYEAPVYPEVWGLEQRGMQAYSEIDEDNLNEAKSLWTKALKFSTTIAKAMGDLKVHKQIVNRLIEPFAYCQVIVTATTYNNYFDLRCGHDAQPEIYDLACKMKDAYDDHIPTALGYREWHTPLVSDTDDVLIRELLEDESTPTGVFKQTVEKLQSQFDNTSPLDVGRIIVSVARCARVSYFLNERTTKTDLVNDSKLFTRLFEDKHMSPFEHVAQPVDYQEFEHMFYKNDCAYEELFFSVYFDNFELWQSVRHIIDDGGRILFELNTNVHSVYKSII